MDGTSWKSSLKSPGQLMTKHSEHIDSASTHCLEAGIVVVVSRRGPHMYHMHTGNTYFSSIIPVSVYEMD